MKCYRKGSVTMKKLQKEFEDFNDEIKIGTESDALRDKREKLKSDMEDYFPGECAKYNIDINKSDLRFIHQGSYKIGTTISNPGKSIDLDYAVIFPLDISEYDDPRDLKKAARNALEIKNVRIPVIMEPCVTVAYHSNGNETMHIDFPIYADYNSCLYLARGKEFSENFQWEQADPEGLNNYFLEKFKDNEQLKRIVRYIKKWKQEKYNNSTSNHEVPPSVGLTILACEHYHAYTDDDLSSLYYTMKAIREQFTVSKDWDGTITEATITCNLPVIPYSNVFYKMTSSHLKTFYNRLDTAVENLREAVNLSEAYEAAKYVQKVLGSDFTIPPKEAKSADTHNKGEYSFG